jgi:uncharacterized protein (DUF2249 family)
MSGNSINNSIVDVRIVPPAHRHPLIFARLEQLAMGESIMHVRSSTGNSMAGRLGLVYTSDFLLDETLTLLGMRLGHAAAVQFGKLVQVRP